jgi:ketosteroid isomerase-like protein
VHAALAKLEQDWNRGDMEAYLAAHLQDPELTVVAGNTLLRGWDAFAARYRTAWPDPRAMGTFHVGAYRLQALAPGLVLASGVFEHRFPVLHVDGAFTHIYRKISPGVWKIAHEHTSRGATRVPEGTQAGRAPGPRLSR